jgi:DnaK suppressor protein
MPFMRPMGIRLLLCGKHGYGCDPLQSKQSRCKPDEENMMGDKTARLDPAFVEGKRRQLLKLRDELRQSANAAEAEERTVENESSLQAREYEDDAQKLDTLEKEGHAVARGVERLARVERALSKIQDGTYGFSDLSGHRIPDDRLEAVPDAITTVAEQEASERAGQQTRANR